MLQESVERVQPWHFWDVTVSSLLCQGSELTHMLIWLTSRQEWSQCASIA
jgi:hypothetical protein